MWANRMVRFELSPGGVPAEACTLILKHTLSSPGFTLTEQSTGRVFREAVVPVGRLAIEIHRAQLLHLSYDRIPTVFTSA